MNISEYLEVDESVIDALATKLQPIAAPYELILRSNYGRVNTDPLSPTYGTKSKDERATVGLKIKYNDRWYGEWCYIHPADFIIHETKVVETIEMLRRMLDEQIAALG